MQVATYPIPPTAEQGFIPTEQGRVYPHRSASVSYRNEPLAFIYIDIFRRKKLNRAAYLIHGLDKQLLLGLPSMMLLLYDDGIVTHASDFRRDIYCRWGGILARSFSSPSRRLTNVTVFFKCRRRLRVRAMNRIVVLI